MAFVCKRCSTVRAEGRWDICIDCIDVLIQISDSTSKLIHITEQNYPEQTKAFREIIEKMYKTHLDKNADYSPWNILATGMVGLSTRILDKTARIMSLIGFNIGTGEYDKEKQSLNDESIDDNLLDLAVYSIIGIIYRKGLWGK